MLLLCDQRHLTPHVWHVCALGRSEGIISHLTQAKELLDAARPTAVNLSWVRGVSWPCPWRAHNNHCHIHCRLRAAWWTLPRVWLKPGAPGTCEKLIHHPTLNLTFYGRIASPSQLAPLLLAEAQALAEQVRTQQCACGATASLCGGTRALLHPEIDML